MTDLRKGLITAGLIFLGTGISFSIGMMTAGFLLLILAYLLKPLPWSLPKYFLFFYFFLMTYSLNALLVTRSLKPLQDIFSDYWYFLLLPLFFSLVEEKEKELFLKTLRYAFLLAALYAVFQGLTGINFYKYKLEPKLHLWKFPVYMALGTFNHHLTFGGQMMGLSLLFRKRKLFFLAGAAALFLAVPHSAWIGFFAALFVYIVFARKKYAGLLFLLPFVILAVFPAPRKLFLSKMGERTAIWQAGLDMFKKNPLQGIGEG
ncbi:MAG TPA: hypothetical protein VJC03_05300, partial [bacterium]|nr:hypothetical protein [bacterium]